MSAALPGAQAFHWRGHRLDLLGAKAVWDPQQRTLLLADLHLGKAECLQAQGIPLPSDGDAATLDALLELAHQLQPEQVVVLGGAALAADLLAADQVQELQLTLCPRLLGGHHTWLPGAGPLPGDGAWRLLESRSLGGDELLLRYGRGADHQRASAVAP